MIEPLDNLPEGVDGFRLVGEITKADYEEVMIPWVKSAVESGEIRCVIVIGPEFEGYEAGAAWEDAKLGVGNGLAHASAWKRMALVTETRWIRHMAAVFGWMMPGELKLFPLGSTDAAKSWAAGNG